MINKGPIWQSYERSVRDLLAAMDVDAQVRHDVHVPGLRSGVLRQVDVFATGTIVGAQVKVAVECKRFSRPADISVVDHVVGKLLDIGADIGFLFSYAGFTTGAVTRADGASNPRIIPISLADEQHDGYVACQTGPSSAVAFLADELDVEGYRELLSNIPQ